MDIENNLRIYEVLSQLTGLKFKAQFTGSGIELKSIYKVKELNEFSLSVDDSKIRFTNADSFIHEFNQHLKDHIISLKRESHQLQSQLIENKYFDKYAAFYEEEEIGSSIDKLNKLVKKLESLRK